MHIRFLPLLMLVFLPACGGSNPPVAPPPVETGEALKELGEVYKYISVQKLATPRKAEDLTEYEGTLAGALPKIRAGDIVVIWGVGYSSGSSQVLAYGKDASSNGGPVLLRNGTIKAMTAAELQAAKK